MTGKFAKISKSLQVFYFHENFANVAYVGYCFLIFLSYSYLLVKQLCFAPTKISSYIFLIELHFEKSFFQKKEMKFYFNESDPHTKQCVFNSVTLIILL
jgi:hypothetical protein